MTTITAELAEHVGTSATCQALGVAAYAPTTGL